MPKYNPQKIEKKWQKSWYSSDVFAAKNNSKKPKFYLLDEFPYPSGDGLHVGHCRPYIGLDVIARKRRMQGQNVLFPMGWDAFGLPTENYAIKMKVQPSVVTKKNTDTFRKQMKNIGLSFDWSREINTTDPAYYKWTQWIFIKLFEAGLAQKEALTINWCPKDKIGLANEEVIAGKCERCGTPVEKKDKVQWVIKITKYADRLIKDLELVDYPDRVKQQQVNWIGRSEGAEIEFSIASTQFPITVFTTRPDTIFGCTFLVLAPEHPAVNSYKDVIKNWEEVNKYVLLTKNKSDLQRQENKEKTGVELKGIKAVNPATKKEIPVFVADYVMMGYGTGAIMAVPSDDVRDKEFAQKYQLPIIEGYQKAGFEDFGKKTVQYKLRDWVFSRQHYWGEPIPMIFCASCGWQPVPEKELPVELPKVKKYEPTDNGESPLAAMTKWVNVKCPKCKGDAKRETDTMPNWAGSNWYYLAYTVPGISNFKFQISNFAKGLEQWMPVDWYNGGMEHTTLHLLYSRFIFKFLWDIGAVPKSIGSEPYKKRTSHGFILGEGGIKMSKSRGNVLNPDDVIKEYGADTLRVYEMFMGPFEQMIPWDTKGIVGAKRFLEKVYNYSHNIVPFAPNFSDGKALAELNKAIKKVSQDIEEMKFNTAISSLMIFMNTIYQDSLNGIRENVGMIQKEDWKKFLIILSPFAPHLAEELWSSLKFKGQCSQQKWPEYNELLQDKTVILAVQINGKTRGSIKVERGISRDAVMKIILEDRIILPWLGLDPKKREIRAFIPDKLISIVVYSESAQILS